MDLRRRNHHRHRHDQSHQGGDGQDDGGDGDSGDTHGRTLGQVQGQGQQGGVSHHQYQQQQQQQQANEQSNVDNISSRNIDHVSNSSSSTLGPSSVTVNNVNLPIPNDNDYQQLCDHIEQLRKTNFSLFVTLNNLGVTYLRERRYVESIQCFSDAAKFVSISSCCSSSSENNSPYGSPSSSSSSPFSLTVQETPTCQAYYLLLDDNRRRIDGCGCFQDDVIHQQQEDQQNRQSHSHCNGQHGSSSNNNSNNNNQKKRKRSQSPSTTSHSNREAGRQTKTKSNGDKCHQRDSCRCCRCRCCRCCHEHDCDSTYVFQYPIVMANEPIAGVTTTTTGGNDDTGAQQQQQQQPNPPHRRRRANGSGEEEATIKLSLVVLYNMSLAYHRAALDLDSLEVLQQALVHYEVAYRILISDTRVLVSQAMVILNNIGHIHRLMNHEDRALACFQYLLTTMIYVQQTGESRHIHHWDSFFSNVVDLIVPHPRPAPAA